MTVSIGRAFNGIASAYSAAQTQPRRVRRFQKRTLTVDFNGAIPAGDLVQRVKWECTSPWVTHLSSAGIDDGRRVVSVVARFDHSGCGHVKATIETAVGDSYNYSFEFDVLDAPMFPSASYQPSAGPFSVSAEVVVEV